MEEICKACTAKIPDGVQVFLWREEQVCGKCYRLLRARFVDSASDPNSSARESVRGAQDEDSPPLFLGLSVVAAILRVTGAIGILLGIVIVGVNSQRNTVTDSTLVTAFWAIGGGILNFAMGEALGALRIIATNSYAWRQSNKS